MLIDVQFYLLMLGIATIIYWLIPCFWPRVRIYWLITVSILMVLSAAPLSGMIIIGLSFLGWFWSKIFLHWRYVSILWLVILTLLSPIVIQRIEIPDASIIITLGVAFFTVKIIGFTLDCYSRPAARSARDTVLYAVFFRSILLGR